MCNATCTDGETEPIAYIKGTYHCISSVLLGLKTTGSSKPAQGPRDIVPTGRPLGDVYVVSRWREFIG